MGSRRSSVYRQREADLHNLYPSETKVNARRGHLPFGEVVQNLYQKATPSKIGLDAQGREVVDVRPEYRGDVARTILYMSVRWQMPLPKNQSLSLLQAWSKLDPPSDLERKRDQLIFGIQGNSNPLVSCPELVPSLIKAISSGKND
jgi:endonuclease I